MKRATPGSVLHVQAADSQHAGANSMLSRPLLLIGIACLGVVGLTNLVFLANKPHGAAEASLVGQHCGAAECRTVCSMLAAAGGRRDSLTASATAAALTSARPGSLGAVAGTAVCSPAPNSSDATLSHFRDHVLPSLNFSYERAPAADYWVQPNAQNQSVTHYRDTVAAYLKSNHFQQRWREFREGNAPSRGIVISAGGRYYLPQAIAFLRTLRHELNCTLPVELFYYGSEEMDEPSIQALKREFDPLEAIDARAIPYPAHHVPGAKLKGFPMKPYALLNSRFKQAFLMDADVMLLRDPSFMFDGPTFRSQGSLFWSDIYNEGMNKDEVYEYVGLKRDAVKPVLQAGKAQFPRYAESGQIMIDRARHLDVLEWVWFLNSFSDKHIYEFMYGDKDTYALGFALAGKAHEYAQLNMPPAGIFTHRDALGWQPGKEQMRKQGNWWLHALVHYGEDDEVLLGHRVTGEIQLGLGTPKDELITPPLPLSWSMWFMGYGPNKELQRTLAVMAYNLTALLADAAHEGGQECPLQAWSAYWYMRTHGIPTRRRRQLERSCDAMLDAQYGREAAALIRSTPGLMERPLRIGITPQWDAKPAGGYAPRPPLLAVPFNMTDGFAMWERLQRSHQWANSWVAAGNVPVLKGRRRRHLLGSSHAADAGAGPGQAPAAHPQYWLQPGRQQQTGNKQQRQAFGSAPTGFVHDSGPGLDNMGRLHPHGAALGDCTGGPTTASNTAAGGAAAMT